MADKQDKSNEAQNNQLAQADNSNARYIIIDKSLSAHCCFQYTIVDTKEGQENDGDWKRTMCETFDRVEAEIICDALNKHCC